MAPGQTKQSVIALHRINAELVDWASQQAKPGRWLHGGEVELFFDDTEIEVDGHQFEGARINYEGNRALSWQDLWYGPWLLDGILDGAGDVSEHLPVLLEEHQHRWQGRANYFYADSGSSAGKSSIGSSEPVLAVGASATTSGPTNWIAWPPSCPTLSGVRCPRLINPRSNTPGSSTSQASASRCRSLPPCAGSRMET